MNRHHKHHHSHEAHEPAAVPPPDAPQNAEQASPAGEMEPQVQKLQAERDDLLGRLQRLAADFQNYQKRSERDVSQAREYANEQLLRELLPVLDDMERAMDAARENHEESDPLLAGMKLVHGKALTILGKFGLTQIEAAGAPFDPQLHQAMMQQPSGEHPEHTVLKELQKGYQLKGRTIRPAAVIVSITPKGETPKE